MIKAVLVDDETLVLKLLEKIIRDTSEVEIAGAYTDPEQALIEIPRLAPDVVFLDVDMPEMNGIELATKLIETHQNEEMAIVFVTAYEHYAIRAFELNAIHYILKPADAQSVDEVLKRIYQKKGVERPKNAPNDCSQLNSEIYLFGNMHLRVNGSQVDFLTPKIEELLALLILHREKGISKWSIIDVLWEDASMEKSQQNLYTMIFRLKQSLQNAGIHLNIRRKNSMYRIELESVYCDLLEFDSLIEKTGHGHQKNIAEFEKAIAIYQGDLLESKDYLWCLPLRERYYQQFVVMAMALSAYYVEHHETDKLKQLEQQVKPLLLEEDFEKLNI